MQHNYQ